MSSNAPYDSDHAFEFGLARLLDGISRAARGPV